MTVGAHVTTCDQSLDGARAAMRDEEIRHLPVLQNGVVVGILSDRDLSFIDRLPGVRANLIVENAMTPDPYVVEASEPIDVVAREMARRKIGSAVVAKNGKVVGIFTAVDALELLAEIVEAGGNDRESG